MFSCFSLYVFFFSLSFAFITCVASMCGMIFFGFVFLLLATFISRPKTKASFNTSAKHSCAKALNIIVSI